MRVAAAHEEPLSDEEAPNVAATDLNDVLLRDSNQPAAPDSLFPLSESAVVTFHVTQCAAELGVDAAGGVTKVSVNSMSLKDVGAELERIQRASGYDNEAAAQELHHSTGSSIMSGALSKLSLLDYDAITCGEEWTVVEKRGFGAALLIHVVWFVLMLFHVIRLDGKAHLPGRFFWIRQAVMVGALSFLYLLCGALAATSARFSASAMRKLCHLALYACVPVTMFLFPEHLVTPAQARTMTLWTAWTSLVPFYMLIKPIRQRVTPCMLAFRAFDREDDRPYTLEFMVVHAVAGLAPVIGTMILLASSVPAPGSSDATPGVRLMLVLIPVIMNSIGDNLACVIGSRFGRHTYRARALWFQGRCCSGNFTRSVEGSACVLISGALAVGIFRLFYSTTQFAVAMAAFPLGLAFVEAISPRAWEAPCIHAAGGAILIIIERLLPGCAAMCPNRFSLFGIPYVKLGQ